MRIKCKDIEYKFKINMQIWEYHRYRKQFDEDPKTSLPDWWMTKSEFGLFMLRKLLTNGVKLLDIDEEDWELFHPVFEHYFVTPIEFDAIKANVLFWNGKSEKVYENASFIEWILTDHYMILNEEDRYNMGFKNQMILYYYAILNKVTQNAQEIVDRLGYVPENKEKETEGDMYG